VVGGGNHALVDVLESLETIQVEAVRVTTMSFRLPALFAMHEDGSERRLA